MQNTNDYTKILDIVSVLAANQPIIIYTLIVMVASIIAMAAYLILRDRLSKYARDIAEAQKAMAETVRSNTESVASTPQIVTAFSEIIRENVKMEIERVNSTVEKTIIEQTQKYTNLLTEAVSESNHHLSEIKSTKLQIEELAASTASQYQNIRNEYEKIQSVLPDYELWKSVADPDILTRKLFMLDTWDDAKDLVGQLQRLVGDSAAHPEQIPAKYIEVSGDWCRNHNQFPLALWFYDQSVKRDPERISSKVEHYALMAEYVPQRRNEALEELKALALVSGDETLKRIFNVFIEIDRYEDLVDITTRLLNSPDCKENNKRRALLLRNRAIARKNIGINTITKEAWDDIKAAYECSDDDEGVLVAYATFLYNSGNYEQAIRFYQKLISIDYEDIRYYKLLSECFAHLGQRKQAMTVLEIARNFVHDELGLSELEKAVAHVDKLTALQNNEFVKQIQEICAKSAQIVNIKPAQTMSS